MKLNTSKISVPGLWDAIRAYEGKEFVTKKGLPFTYTIKGGELFVDRRSKSITRATFEQALDKLRENPDAITGPKSLNVFGAPYVWAILKTFQVV